MFFRKVGNAFDLYKKHFLKFTSKALNTSKVLILVIPEIQLDLYRCTKFCWKIRSYSG